MLEGAEDVFSTATRDLRLTVTGAQYLAFAHLDSGVLCGCSLCRFDYHAGTPAGDGFASEEEFVPPSTPRTALVPEIGFRTRVPEYRARRRHEQ